MSSEDKTPTFDAEEVKRRQRKKHYGFENPIVDSKTEGGESMPNEPEPDYVHSQDAQKKSE